jgi:integrase
MALVKIRGVKAYVSKGTTYAYHRASGTRLIASYGSSAFLAELDAVSRKHTKTTESTRPGTWGALVVAYKTSPKFLSELKARTRSDYDKVFAWLSDLDTMPLTDWSRGFSTQLRDKAYDRGGWHFANEVLTATGSAFTWGWERQMVEEHPVRGVKRLKRPKGQRRANRPWRDEEWALVTAIAAPHLLAPILLCGVLGWREGEVVSRPRTDYDQSKETIQRVSSKSGKLVKTSAPRIVADALNALLPHDAITLLVNSRGRPWTEDGFRASVFAFIGWLEEHKLVGPGLTVHGLRHTCATRMKELGIPKELRMEMLGQSSEGMAEWYSRDADMQAQLAGVVAKMEGA